MSETLTDKITRFRGKYAFLSNFFPCGVIFEDIGYRSAEAAYQSAKTLDRKERLKICRAETPGKAKKLGQKVKLRDDWEDVKWDMMFSVVWSKFGQNKLLATMLLKTEDTELIEGNTWGDAYWGVCNGRGSNNLGKILMKVRKMMRKMQEKN